MEKRVTARTKARARAARPMSEAPRTDAPSGRAVLSETGRPLTLLGALEPDDGWSVGNRPPALPPGLSVGLMEEVIPGRLPTGSGDVVVIGNAGVLGEVDGLGDVDVDGVTVPEIWTVADDVGSVGRLAALPVTVSLTDFTDVAVVGTVDSAWSCRLAEVASIPPRLHDAVPSSLPQPKLNFGTTLDGVDRSRTIASVRSPPVVQAVTTHWVAAPRLLLESEVDISTQRLTGGSLWTACAPLLGVEDAVPEAEGEGVVEGGSPADRDGDADGLFVGSGELDGVAFGEELADGLALAVLVGVAVGFVVVLVGVGEVLGDGDELGVEDAVGVEDAADDLEGLADGEVVGVADLLAVLAELVVEEELGASVCLTSSPPRANVLPGLTLVLVLDESVGVGVSDGGGSLLVAVGVGVGVDECVGVGVGVAVGGGFGGLSGLHDSLLVTAAASSAATA